MILQARPKRLSSWGYEVSSNGRFVAIVDLAWVRERGVIHMDNQEFTVFREGILHGAFFIESHGRTLARAEKPSAMFRAFEVHYGDRLLELRALSIFTRSFGLFEKSRQVGRVRADHWRTWQATIELADDIELPIAIFLFWLVIILWRRAARRD